MAFEHKPTEQETGPRRIALKHWTATDEITHDFADSETWRQYCLDKYGQYMSATGMRVMA